MSDTGPLRRRWVASAWIVGVLCAGGAAGGAWLTYRQPQPTLTDSGPRLTRTAVDQPADTTTTPPPAVASRGDTAPAQAAESASPARHAAGTRPSAAGSGNVAASPSGKTASRSGSGTAQVSGSAGSAPAGREETTEARATQPIHDGARSAVAAGAGDAAPRVVTGELQLAVSGRTDPAGEADGAAPPAHDGTTAGDTIRRKPSFDIVRVAPSGSAVIAGRAAPGAAVTLLDNGRPIAHGTADESGQFVVLPDKPLPAGGQELALQAATPGSAPVTGDTPALLVVPARPSDQAHGVASAPALPADKPAEAVAVLAPGNAAPRLLTVPSDPPGSSGQVALRVVDYDTHGAIRFAGTARPGSSVRLYIDNTPVGDAPADAQGRWSLVPAGTVSAGGHHLRADELGSHGQVLSRAELPFERADFAPDTLREGQVVVQPRQSLWRIARHVYGHGIRYTLIYEANRDQIRNPNRIYPGQIFALPAAAR